ncbi:d-ala-D-ala dipeptidase domain-containing protein [Ditylenchus destructor]|uniref:D-ala-D-ala dipeptidase domain-containing protein n=1 Tax=Ditylenchus destructor TaxID=166010 RepID=A0AAD4R8T0_9BILA|nr:d-ala-D-ala dipeptidase domain-containing protein [Ditylenchus destructor]
MIRTFYFATYLMSQSYFINSLPEGFVFVQDVDPGIKESIRYSTNENFLGQPFVAYKNGASAILTLKAAQALSKVQKFLRGAGAGYSLVIYDAYRPMADVEFFSEMMKDEPNNDQKAKYYPFIDKHRIFAQGFLSPRSSHSRGSTVDLTLIERDKQVKAVHARDRILSDGRKIFYLDDNTVDMGSSFDLFDDASYINSSLVDPNARNMRNFLRQSMEKHGFVGYDKIWWHYTLRDEPYPNTYYDFAIEVRNATASPNGANGRKPSVAITNLSTTIAVLYIIAVIHRKLMYI